jgi:hypothetical protein
MKKIDDTVVFYIGIFTVIVVLTISEAYTDKKLYEERIQNLEQQLKKCESNISFSQNQ